MTEPSQYFKGRTVQEQMNEVIGYVDTRAAEVATTAIASDVAQVHQDMLDADADAQAAAASAAAAAGTLANAVKKTGEASQSIAGDIAVSGNLSGGSVTVPTPVNNNDAANKKYVNDQDALKISISAINSYAVGLTGNQTAAGIKKFPTLVMSNSNTTRVPTTSTMDLCSITFNPGATYTFNILIDGRFDVALAQVAVVIAADSTITSVTVNALGLFLISNTRQLKFGARISGTKLILSATPAVTNYNVGAIVLSANVSGYVSAVSLAEYGTVNVISGLSGYVQEA